MIIEETFIKGIYVIKPTAHIDERGFFMESYRQDILSESKIEDLFIQDNHSMSVYRNTVRGLNFQYKPPMAKIMRVTRGSAFLVAVDIRKNSPTLGKWFGIESSADNKIQLYAEAGFARGFQTLEDNTEVQYKCSSIHNKDGEGQIIWDDRDIGINWPIKEKPILSDRNLKAPTFKDWLLSKESDMIFNYKYEENKTF